MSKERHQMKKLLAVIPVTLFLTACSTMGGKKPDSPQMSPLVVPTPIADKADPPKIPAAGSKSSDLDAARVANNIPVWYFQTPIQEGFLFGTGTGRSRDLSMAKEKALTEAQGKIAESVGGRVTKQTKTFRTEAGSNVIENNNTITKKTAIDVDFTGTEVREVVVNLEPGGNFRVFVLVSLPLGENNQVLKQQMEAEITRRILSNQQSFVDEPPTNVNPSTDHGTPRTSPLENSRTREEPIDPQVFIPPPATATELDRAGQGMFRQVTDKLIPNNR